MKNQRTVSIICIAILTIVSFAAAYGQAARTCELNRRKFTQLQTNVNRPPDEDIRAIDRTDKTQGNYPKKNALIGTWDVVLTAGDGSNVRSTLQIFSGPADGEGSAIHASEFSLAPPSPTLPEQGSWRYVKDQQFVASYFGYSFDEQLQPFGKIGFKHSITVADDQDHFTGEALFQVLDPDGNVVFSDTFRTRGVRQRAVAP